MMQSKNHKTKYTENEDLLLCILPGGGIVFLLSFLCPPVSELGVSLFTVGLAIMMVGGIARLCIKPIQSNKEQVFRDTSASDEPAPLASTASEKVEAQNGLSANKKTNSAYHADGKPKDKRKYKA